MCHFWEGFEKRSVEQDQSVTKPALAAGAGTTGVLGAARALSNYRQDVSRANMTRRRNFNKFLSQLQPGDLLFSRSNIEVYNPLFKGKLLSKIKIPHAINLAHGDPSTHAMIYKGKGNIIQAKGEGQTVATNRLRKGDDIEAYRPQVSKGTKSKALAYAEKTVGAKYPTKADVAAEGAKSLLGVGPKTCRTAKGSQTCSSLVANAYPELFDKNTMSMRELKGAKNVKHIASYGKIAPLTTAQKFLMYGLHPVLKNLKWGLGAAGLTAAALKGKQLFDQQKSKDTADYR